MEQQFQVRVFGKGGCEKCGILNQRLDKILAKDEWSAFEKAYFDVNSEEGLVAFCEAECINPQRIPAFVVMRCDEDDSFVPVANRNPGAEDSLYGESKLYQYVGLQTDYTESGRGVISPRMITGVLTEAVQ